MKELFNILEKDYLKEGFSKSEVAIFGIIIPGMFIILLVMFGLIQAWALQ